MSKRNSVWTPLTREPKYCVLVDGCGPVTGLCVVGKSDKGGYDYKNSVQLNDTQWANLCAVVNKTAMLDQGFAGMLERIVENPDAPEYPWRGGRR